MKFYGVNWQIREVVGKYVVNPCLIKMIMESSGAIGIADVAAPNPATLELFAGEVREMLDGLGDEVLRQIAILKLEGYTNPEVAQRLNIALRSVERKLLLIRDKIE